MTSATFDFDDEHSLGVCAPQPGKIVGVIHPDLDGGEYELTFMVDGNECGTADGESQAGEDIPVRADHQCGSGKKNVAVRVSRVDNGSVRNQMPIPVCLA